MALRTPPSWLQNGSHPAENDRLTNQTIFATTGIVKPTSLQVTESGTPAMTVAVASGWAAIVGDYQPNMGVYVVYNDAPVTLNIATADPTNPRIDRVVITVEDAYYTGSTNTVTLQVLTGTPAGSPVAPAVPTNSISLATIAVGVGAFSITNANITDTRVETTTNLPVGDILSVIAGSGLSGGGTSGTVTLSLDRQSASTLTINAQSATTYTPVLTDADMKLVTLSNANPIAVTLPPNSSVAYPVGVQLNMVQTGAGQVTISGGVGVTVYSAAGIPATPKTRAQYSALTCVQTAANTWLVIGDLA